MTNRKERGCWLRSRCYACGHALAYDSTACPQCGEDFDGRKDPRKWPATCTCERCKPDVVCQHGTAMDVHCCNCHSGFIFDRNHECPPEPVALPAVNREGQKAEARAVADRLTRLRLSSDEDVSTAVQNAAELLYDWPEVNAELLEALKGLLDVIAADDLVPESVSYMKQARKAVRDAEVSR